MNISPLLMDVAERLAQEGGFDGLIGELHAVADDLARRDAEEYATRLAAGVFVNSGFTDPLEDETATDLRPAIISGGSWLVRKLRDDGWLRLTDPSSVLRQDELARIAQGDVAFAVYAPHSGAAQARWSTGVTRYQVADRLADLARQLGAAQ